MQSFSKTGAIQFGWGVVKKNFWFILSVMVIVGLVSYLPSFLLSSYSQQMQRNGSAGVAGLLFIPIWIVQTILSMGMVKITLDLVDGKKPKYEDLYQQYPKFISYLVASILYGLIVLAGLILLIIPGIYLAIKFQYYTYLIIDKNLGPVEALKESSRLTQGNIWNLFLFDILAGLVTLLGYIVLFVGVLVSAPVAIIAAAFVYRTLSGGLKNRQPEAL
jgi:uncharacterized membrane protein